MKIDQLKIGEDYAIQSAFTGEVFKGNYRGRGFGFDCIVVWTGKSQIEIPVAWVLSKANV